MKHRYCIEIAEDLSTHYCFAYVDTPDNLADFLFSEMEVETEPVLEFHCEGDAFKIVMCRFPRHQREAFLDAVEMLPGLMEYAGKTGYDEFCVDLMRRAIRYMEGRKGAERTSPLQ